jgi:hypothetical protein
LQHPGFTVSGSLFASDPRKAVRAPEACFDMAFMARRRRCGVVRYGQVCRPDLMLALTDMRARFRSISATSATIRVNVLDPGANTEAIEH